MLEDRSALQIALSEVLRAVAANQIDTNRGWLLLSGLRMASQNCGEEELADPIQQIHELELTPEGEQVGPRIEAD
ncbi:MAG TPA: hypothetical protein VKH40_18265 [Alloacidobacterium sp.]|nr:hypothetical protein [Alloacidobacterium sp.]